MEKPAKMRLKQILMLFDSVFCKTQNAPSSNVSLSHKTESEGLKFDHDSVFESIDPETKSSETVLIFSSQLDSIIESWLNLSQSDSVFF